MTEVRANATVATPASSTAAPASMSVCSKRRGGPIVPTRPTDLWIELSSAMAALAVLVAVLAAWAHDQRAVARDRAAAATSLALASSASPLTRSRPDIALLLALEAYRTSPRTEARSALLAALVSARRPGVLAVLHGHGGAVTSVALSPDGRTLASASADATIRLWDVASHTPLRSPLRGHTGVVNAVAFSRDGRTLASAGSDSTVRLWDVRAGTPSGLPLTAHDAAVNSVAFSPDGRTLASASADNTVRLWDAATRRPLGGPLTGHSSFLGNEIVAWLHARCKPARVVRRASTTRRPRAARAARRVRPRR